MSPSLVQLALWLATVTTPTFAVTAGSFADGGNTKVSGMMLFVGNSEKVFIQDKAEGNAAQVNGHPAWGSVWDLNTHQVDVMDVKTNVFCASGMHLPNGSFVTFGGNGAIGPGGNIGSVLNDGGGSGAFDATYQDYDGAKAIRVLSPCKSSDDWNSDKCKWFDDSSILAMQKKRWYSTAEPLADGTVTLIGGFVNGGYINRNYPNTDPDSGGASENTYEFYPANGKQATTMEFMKKTSGLNSYAHAFLLASGKMFVQANISTMIWDPSTNQETALPDMPNNVARVYPASGAVAMLPLTKENDWNPTIIFCGGNDMGEQDYGNFSWPFINTWEKPASKDCQRITPEPADGSSPTYEQDDDMLETRTMGQFIILPTGKLLVVNGGENGTAGYSTQTLLTLDYGQMPYGMSLASGPVGTPAIYDPDAPKGSRWSNAGLGTSSIARLYHSSAILLPDASVLIAGSNPNVDVNLTTVFPTEYRAEIFYPPYFSASTRPVPSGVPSKISYGGDAFDITIPASSYSGSANDAADNTTIALLRPGFTTHAMNMGQRYLRLDNSYTVNSDGSITLHVAQAPPKPEVFQPGPAFLFVVVNGVPSNGTEVIVGSGNFGDQPKSAASTLPANVRVDSASGSADKSTTNGSGSGSTTDSGSSSKAPLIGGIVGAIAAIGILGALIGICLSRKRRAANRQAPVSSYAMSNVSGAGASAGIGAAGAAGVYGAGARDMRNSDTSAFVPLQQGNHSHAWNASTASFQEYRDDDIPGRASGMGMSMDYDPYASQSRMSVNAPRDPHRY